MPKYGIGSRRTGIRRCRWWRGAASSPIPAGACRNGPRNGTAAACRYALARVVEEEFANVGAVGVAKSGVRLLAAATLLEHGSDLQKKKFLRRILTGEDTWCQFFSEPGSGSDLAGATTRADLNGDCWIINGQKVWTTSAHHADHGLLLARTDWDAPKHEGLSYFVIDIKQPGVDVQPLKQMNGHASFNQVFFTDAKVPAENLVGRVGDGWKVAMTTLAHERRGADGLTLTIEARSARGTHLRRRAGRNSKRRISPTNGIRSAPAAWTSSSSAPRRPARTEILTCARRSPS